MATWYRNEKDMNLEIGDWVLGNFYGEKMIMEVSRIKFSSNGVVVGYKLKPAKHISKAKTVNDLEREVQMHNKISGAKIPAAPLSKDDDSYIEYPYINRDPATWSAPNPTKKSVCPMSFANILFGGNLPGAEDLITAAANYILNNLDKIDGVDVPFCQSIFEQWVKNRSCSPNQQPYISKYLLYKNAFALDAVFNDNMKIEDYWALLDPAQQDGYGNWQIRTNDDKLHNFLGADGKIICTEWFLRIDAPFEDEPSIGQPVAEVVRNGNEKAYLTLDGKILDINGQELDVVSSTFAKKRKLLPPVLTDDDTSVEIVDMRPASEGISVVEFEDGRFGYFDTNENVLLCNMRHYGEDGMYWAFDQVRDFKEGFGVVKSAKGYCALGKDGELIVYKTWFKDLGDFRVVNGAKLAPAVLDNGRLVWLDEYGHLHRRK